MRAGPADPRRQRPDPALWEGPDIRAVLAVRDITRLYRLLQAHSYSQQHIAALVGQSQPEVSAITHGRQVQAYDVIERVVEGLGAPAPTPASPTPHTRPRPGPARADRSDTTQVLHLYRQHLSEPALTALTALTAHQPDQDTHAAQLKLNQLARALGIPPNHLDQA
ncbi:MAG TPA: hypothetical protein VLJ59_12230 [Mycobacteriales bacterium]|nr:hypothetical protein [Mycobacteriales bacterium]